MRKQSDDIDLSGETMTKLVKYLNGLKKSIDANTNSLALLKSSVKNSGTQTCQMGTNRCLRRTGYYGKYCDETGKTVYYKVRFSPPFASKPALMVATKSLSLKAAGWWAFWANYKSLTTEGFEGSMKLESGSFYNYEVSWIACGQM